MVWLLRDSRDSRMRGPPMACSPATATEQPGWLGWSAASSSCSMSSSSELSWQSPMKAAKACTEQGQVMQALLRIIDWHMNSDIAEMRL